MYEILDKKIVNSRLIAINALVSSLITIILGIILQVIFPTQKGLISIISFSYGSAAILLALFFDYRYRILQKYRRTLTTAEKTQNDPTQKSDEIKKREIIAYNRPGSLIRNINRYLERN